MFLILEVLAKFSRMQIEASHKSEQRLGFFKVTMSSPAKTFANILLAFSKQSCSSAASMLGVVPGIGAASPLD